MPIGWAKSLATQRLQDAQCFFDAAAHVGVTHDQIRDLVGRIDNERRPQADAFVLVQHAIKSADRFALIAEQGIVDAA